MNEVELEMWCFCILMILSAIGLVALCFFLWISIVEPLKDLIFNYKKYKKFYYENADNSYQKYLEELNEKAKTQKEREEK